MGRGRSSYSSDPARGRNKQVQLDIGDRHNHPKYGMGKVVAKVMQREPNVQTRRDLRRFKQLMETGEIATNASPSGRKADNPPTETHV